MYRLEPALQHYAWGSTHAIPGLLGFAVEERPVAEAWFGAHPLAPARLVGAGAETLDALVSQDPHAVLGEDVVARFGRELPSLTRPSLATQKPPSGRAATPSRSNSPRR